MKTQISGSPESFIKKLATIFKSLEIAVSLPADISHSADLVRRCESCCKNIQMIKESIRYAFLQLSTPT